jgi:hypothetical protein
MFDRRIGELVALSIALVGVVTPRWACGPAGGRITERMKKISYAGYRFPPEIIQ